MKKKVGGRREGVGGGDTHSTLYMSDSSHGHKWNQCSRKKKKKLIAKQLAAKIQLFRFDDGKNRIGPHRYYIRNISPPPLSLSPYLLLKIIKNK